MHDELNEFLIDIGFSKDEVEDAIDELEAYRSIPGTTPKKYLRRTAASAENRKDFLKGLIACTELRDILGD